MPGWAIKLTFGPDPELYKITKVLFIHDSVNSGANDLMLKTQVRDASGLHSIETCANNFGANSQVVEVTCTTSASNEIRFWRKLLEPFKLCGVAAFQEDCDANSLDDTQFLSDVIYKVGDTPNSQTFTFVKDTMGQSRGDDSMCGARRYTPMWTHPFLTLTEPTTDPFT